MSPPRSNIRSWIGRRLLPQDCLLCGDASGADLLCPECRARLPMLGESCPRCALPSPGGQVCGRCRSLPPNFDGTLAVYRYEFPLDRLVQSLKYGGRLGLAAWFGEALACAAAARRRPDLVVPMPLHRTRLAERGFNQAAEIARRVARPLGVRFDPGLARRTRATAPQVDLPLAERARNVRGAFECDADLDGLAIAVVDDVMTSGASLDDLARALKQAGAASVENWLVARALRDV